MEALQTFWSGLDWSVPLDMLISVIPALVCITLHELAHGYVAWRLGDPTAKLSGRLTLNPLKHIDIFGLLMMIVFKFGWAKPVPVDMRNFRNPKRDMAICALAGPVCNFVLCGFLMLIYGMLLYPLSMASSPFADIVINTMFQASYLSLALAIFNLIPISPLDGSKVFFSFLSREKYYKLMRYERYGMIILLVIVAADIIPLSKVTWFVYEKLFFIAEFGFDVVTNIFI